MYPHRIRLHARWDFWPLAGSGPRAGEPLTARLHMAIPGRWGTAGLGNFAGTVRFRRRFQWPARIDPPERVWLTFAGVEQSAAVRLNGEALGRHVGEGPFEFEVTSLLRPRNELVVEVEAAGGAGGIWGEVALEVRASAFLRGVRTWTTGAGEDARLHVVGEVAGTCERPLELYVLADNATVLYTTVQPGPFQAECPAPAGAQAVRVELVNGAVVWYAVELFPGDGSRQCRRTEEDE